MPATAMWVGTSLPMRPQRDGGGLLLRALHLDGVLLGDLLLRHLRVEDLVDGEDVLRRVDPRLQDVPHVDGVARAALDPHRREAQRPVGRVGRQARRSAMIGAFLPSVEVPRVSASGPGSCTAYGRWTREPSDDDDEEEEERREQGLVAAASAARDGGPPRPGPVGGGAPGQVGARSGSAPARA